MQTVGSSGLWLFVTSTLEFSELFHLIVIDSVGARTAVTNLMMHMHIVACVRMRRFLPRSHNAHGHVE